MGILEDTWLSNIFGYPVFRVENESSSEAGPSLQLGELVRRHAKKQSAALYYAKVDTRRIDIARDLSLAGLYVVDVNVTFSIDANACGVPDRFVDATRCWIR